jgi:hypothetical protein
LFCSSEFARRSIIEAREPVDVMLAKQSPRPVIKGKAAAPTYDTPSSSSASAKSTSASEQQIHLHVTNTTPAPAAAASKKSAAASAGKSGSKKKASDYF